MQPEQEYWLSTVGMLAIVIFGLSSGDFPKTELLREGFSRIHTRQDLRVVNWRRCNHVKASI